MTLRSKDVELLNFRAARRQSYRYGRQLRALPAGSDSHSAVARAWTNFLCQFAEDETDIVGFDYLTAEFRRGYDDTDEELRDDAVLRQLLTPQPVYTAAR